MVKYRIAILTKNEHAARPKLTTIKLLREKIMDFGSASIDDLDGADTSALNSEGFGIVKMAHDGSVTDYNDWQSKFTGMSKDAVMGKHFFTQVAPCTNNFMVGQKYDSNDTLDESIDYTFTLKMSPTPVKLRMLKGSGAQYLLVDK